MKYKRWLFLAIGLFVLGLVLGLTTPASTSGTATDDAGLQKLIDLLKPLPQHTLFVVIFAKNAIALLFSFALSPFFCLIPVAALVLNGWLLGWVSTSVIQEKSLGYLLAGLLPHGIVEIPALFLGEAVALSFGTAVMLAQFKKDKTIHLKQHLVYLGIAIALFLPAALIETYITPLFLK
jgi:stage II sporulation protein M